MAFLFCKFPYTIIRVEKESAYRLKSEFRRLKKFANLKIDYKVINKKFTRLAAAKKALILALFDIEILDLGGLHICIPRIINICRNKRVPTALNGSHCVN